MNTGNLDTHQWVMSMHPEIVAEYIEYCDPDAFDPIRLECAVNYDTPSPPSTSPTSSDLITNAYNTSTYKGCLTAIVRYYTPYQFADHSPLIVSFGLGQDVAVNCILGIPFLKRIGATINLSTHILLAHSLNKEFPLDYQTASTNDIPRKHGWDRANFIRPTQQTAPSTTFCKNNNSTSGPAKSPKISTNAISSTSSTVNDTITNGILRRDVKLNPSALAPLHLQYHLSTPKSDQKSPHA